MRIFPLVLLSFLLVAGCANQSPPSTNRTTQQSPVTSADDAEPGSIHNLPVPEGVEAARTALAERLDVDPKEILILEAHEKEWSDSCLGLGGPAESCAAVITPGYDIVMVYEDVEYRYRTNEDGSSVRAEEQSEGVVQ